MWDPAVSSSDYVIGYEDRFKGVAYHPNIHRWYFDMNARGQRDAASCLEKRS